MNENSTVIAVKHLTAEFIGRDISFVSDLGEVSKIQYEVMGMLTGFSAGRYGVEVVLTAPSKIGTTQFTEEFFLKLTDQVRVYYANVPF